MELNRYKYYLNHEPKIEKDRVELYSKVYNNYIFKNLFYIENPENIKLTQMISRTVENTTLNNNFKLLWFFNLN